MSVSSYSSYEEIEETIEVSSVEDVQVPNDDSSYETIERVLQESEYESYEEEVIHSDYVTDTSNDSDDNQVVQKLPAAKKNDKAQPKNDRKPYKMPHTKKKDAAKSKPTKKSANPKGDQASNTAPVPPPQDPDQSDDEEEDGESGEEDEEPPEESDHASDDADDEFAEYNNVPTDYQSDSDDSAVASDTANEKPVQRLNWKTNNYYGHGDTSCFDAWKQYKPKDYVAEKEKKMKRIERREYVKHRRQVRERKVERQRVKKVKPPKIIQVRRTRQEVIKKRVKKIKPEPQSEPAPAAVLESAAAPVEPEPVVKETPPAAEPVQEVKSTPPEPEPEPTPVEPPNEPEESPPPSPKKETTPASPKKEAPSSPKKDKAPSSPKKADKASKKKDKKEKEKKEKEPSQKKKEKKDAPKPTKPKPKKPSVDLSQAKAPAAKLAKAGMDPSKVKSASTSEVFVALTVRNCDTEPTAAEYTKLCKEFRKYWNGTLKRKYDHYIDMDLSIRKALFNAEIPSDNYNVYLEWDVQAHFAAADESVKVPDNVRVMQDLVNSLSMELLQYHVCTVKKFKACGGAFIQQTATIVRDIPDP